MSWIILEDLVRIFGKLVDEGIEGPINAVRLEALPYTRMCIECAEKEDAKRG